MDTASRDPLTNPYHPLAHQQSELYQYARARVYSRVAARGCAARYSLAPIDLKWVGRGGLRLEKTSNGKDPKHCVVKNRHKFLYRNTCTSRIVRLDPSLSGGVDFVNFVDAPYYVTVLLTGLGSD